MSNGNTSSGNTGICNGSMKYNFPVHIHDVLEYMDEIKKTFQLTEKEIVQSIETFSENVQGVLSISLDIYIDSNGMEDYGVDSCEIVEIKDSAGTIFDTSEIPDFLRHFFEERKHDFTGYDALELYYGSTDSDLSEVIHTEE